MRKGGSPDYTPNLFKKSRFQPYCMKPAGSQPRPPETSQPPLFPPHTVVLATLAASAALPRPNSRTRASLQSLSVLSSSFPKSLAAGTLGVQEDGELEYWEFLPFKCFSSPRHRRRRRPFVTRCLQGAPTGVRAARVLSLQAEGGKMDFLEQ